MKTDKDVIENIVNSLIDELFYTNIKLLTAIKEEDYESAAILRDFIKMAIQNSNDFIFAITAVDYKSELEEENEKIKIYIEKNYDKLKYIENENEE